MRGKFSGLHKIISQKGFTKIFKEYKTLNTRDFCKKYGVSNTTIVKIFGPKMTRSKKVMVRMIKHEGDKRKIAEIAGENIL